MDRRTLIKIGGAVALSGTIAAGDPGGRPGPRPVTGLKNRVKGPVLFPGDKDFAAETRGYNPIVTHRPQAVVVASDAADVAAAVAFASMNGLPVAVQSTGHGIGASARDGILINTRKLDHVIVHPDRRTARIGGGARVRAVVESAAAAGLAMLNGSSLDVGAVGYTLGGGLGPFGRRYGYAADHVRSIDLVTPWGRALRVTPRAHRDLFWALRGGRSNFGVVTGMEIDLFPIPAVYGGALLFPGAAAPQVLAAYAGLRLPDAMTTSLAFLRAPGKPMVIRVTAAFLGTKAAGEQLLAPLLGLGPIQNTLAVVPYAKVGTIYNDPPAAPMPVHERSAFLGSFPVERLLAAAGPDAQLPPGMVEVRQLGGALSREPRLDSAIGHRKGAAHLLFLASPAPAEQAAPVAAAQQKVLDTLKADLSGGTLPTFMSAADISPERVRAAYEPRDYARLLRIKKNYDPRNLFRVNHNLR
ncbi:FAD-binding oxidoreductase [Nonomuraea typhae]|uniref:FAD-binding oxidoreductase n=1 Tax=Nonomuraea typhae TaxID=2603600 RepID=UPI0012F948B4|nr:FAD-binding oxidoreductase [Nonomuraea typhae]